MGKYILRRLIIALPSLLGISLILFVLLALAPGDPFGELASNSNIPPEVQEALRVKFGIDDPILIRYFRWLVAMLDAEVIPLEFDGVRAANQSRGHRILADGSVSIGRAGTPYLAALERAKVAETYMSASMCLIAWNEPI